MGRILYVFTCLLLGVSYVSYGQNDPQFSLFMFNPLYYNPAAAGSEGVSRFQLTHRTQWAGYQSTYNDGGAPGTQLLSFNTPLNKIKSGIGVYLLNDKLGPFINQAAEVSYAYRITLKQGTLAIGAQAGLYARGIDYAKLRPADPTDPLIPTGRFMETRPDIGAGVYYNTVDYWIGASVVHLNKASATLENGRSIIPQNQTAYLTAGYRLGIGYDLDVQPSILYQYVVDPQPNMKASSITGNLLVTYDNRYWIGASYRQGDAFSGTIGLNLLTNKSLRLGYAFDFTTNSYIGKSPGSHEIMVSYNLPTPDGRKKPIVRTPRFRY
ncbi:PorP/SprF family type IX secretion system membrane protein [Arsenicibacter rosenii]|uniref:Type IX secretion system membrane protein PorP/SprF n=1 Tax=Arsenicibacter rosenii TaxID=1750698 RepID=A0A1S2VM56_9BACT|nr:type IX secretion system membrane protein PorP/SprF [Arsenicibacter rosenii]OIN58878.1 hypothetical protein BLX24_11660 [Arsenicibacter rosenii]